MRMRQEAEALDNFNQIRDRDKGKMDMLGYMKRNQEDMERLYKEQGRRGKSKKERKDR